VDDLFTLVYAELRRIAGRQLRGERSGHTLCTTALVHEAWFELAKLERIRWQSRSHFLALAAQAMRRVLIDYAVAVVRMSHSKSMRSWPSPSGPRISSLSTKPSSASRQSTSGTRALSSAASLEV
jgi:hypothetical protein